MSFASGLRAFQDGTAEKFARFRDGVDAECFRSIVHGSEITGAPGQPFDPNEGDKNAGELRDSWTMGKSDTETVIATDCSYAPDVESNLKGAHFRNHGPYSVALTVAGFPRIVAEEAAKVAQ